MNKKDLIKTIRSNLFAKRDTLGEAFDYFNDIINTIPKKDQAAVITATAVVLNTLADAMEKAE